jgi:predicted RecB family nuclease
MTSKIKPSYFYNLYRPSKCDLRLYLQLKGVEPAPSSAFEQVLFRLGQRHEKKHLSTFHEFTDLTRQPSERTWDEIRKASPVIYQGELRAQVSMAGKVLDIVGIPDFMIKEGAGYFIRDCKIARQSDSV